MRPTRKGNVPLQELSASLPCLADAISRRVADIVTAQGDSMRCSGGAHHHRCRMPMQLISA
jgi:hypothetical protein